MLLCSPIQAIAATASLGREFRFAIRPGGGLLQLQTFKTREEALERIKEVQARVSIRPDRVFDPEDPKSDAEGYKWVISMSLHQDADKLYVCTDGNLL
jgi:hypothetical protein